jgi:hypothetical protein
MLQSVTKIEQNHLHTMAPCRVAWRDIIEQAMRFKRS